MFKQLLLGIIAVSAVAILWTEADAGKRGNCLVWGPPVGGSEVCAVWATKGVECEIITNGQCGSEGEDCSFECKADADANNSIAFCQAGNGPITRRTCPVALEFTGPLTFGCDPKHDKDNDDVPGGKGHDKNHQCTTTITLTAVPECNACCDVGEICVDATPITMTTTVEAFSGEQDLYTEYVGEGNCGEGSSFCEFQETCSIPEKQIRLGARRPYECALVVDDG